MMGNGKCVAKLHSCRASGKAGEEGERMNLLYLRGFINLPKHHCFSCNDKPHFLGLIVT